MRQEIKDFIEFYTKELQGNNAVIFAGAGLSMPAGFVDWSNLLKPLAQELSLDVEKEQDLVALAQYHANELLGNKNSINQRIVNEFTRNKKLTENHKILARLPISTYWTTNYDNLIEKSLDTEGKVADVKYTVNQLATTIHKRDAVVYKMHGDANHADSAIIIKDDYETYFSKMAPYVTALSGDLVSKTFLFLGFSFTDPNLDYILSRVRSTYNNHQRRHYCMLKKVIKNKNESETEYNYRSRRQELFIKDLNRFNITTLLLDDYSEITAILSTIEKNLRRNTIFISGSAHDYGSWEEKNAQDFIHLLSKVAIQKEFDLVSGFGLGVGSFVINGALEEIYVEQKKNNEGQLTLRPFPQSSTGNLNINDLWTRYREDMISRAGISIFIFGNKLLDSKVVEANGIEDEFEIAKSLNTILVPVATTGYVAEKLWTKMKSNLASYYPFTIDAEFEELFDNLANKELPNEEMVDNIFEFIKMVIQKSMRS